MSWPPEHLLTGPSKPISLTPEEENEAARLWRSILDSGEYVSPMPKWQFLCWATDHRGVLAHGSNSRSIRSFEPRVTTDWFGRVARAVFATEDGIWPMYFAIIDRARYVGSLRNVFHVDRRGNRRYWFSINERLLADPPLTGGAIYLLPAAAFVRTLGDNGEGTQEWMASDPVVPIARVDVEPADFPFLDQLAGHEDEMSARLVELQPVVLAKVLRIESAGAGFRVVVDEGVRSEAAELAVLLNDAGLDNTSFDFEESTRSLIVSGDGAENLIEAIRRFTTDR